MFRQRPMFPGSCPPSIFGAEKLNYCVRDGNRCVLLAIATRSSLSPSLIGKSACRFSSSLRNSSSFPQSALRWRFLGALRLSALYKSLRLFAFLQAEKSHPLRVCSSFPQNTLRWRFAGALSAFFAQTVFSN